MCSCTQRVSNHKECNVRYVSIFEDLIAARLNHFPVGYYYLPTVESFLFSHVSVSVKGVESAGGTHTSLSFGTIRMAV